MTLERAAEILDPQHRENYDSIEIVNEACEIGRKAIEKQIPMKPIKDSEDYEFYKSVFLLDKSIRGKATAKEPDKKKLIRWYNGLDNDGARYRMLGNSLAIPCALRVIGGIADYERRN